MRAARIRSRNRARHGRRARSPHGRVARRFRARTAGWRKPEQLAAAQQPATQRATADDALLESARLSLPTRAAEQSLMTQTYTAQDIEVLSGLEPVRRRPGMYTDTSRPNHLAHEVVDNSVDEALAGHCDRIEVTLLQGRLDRGRRRRPRHAGGHPPEGEGERRRADPHAPARGRQVLRQDLQVLRRPARRGRVGGERAVEAPRDLGAPRRQGIQHHLQERQGALEARGGGRGRQGQHRHHGALLARRLVLRQRRGLGAEAASTCSRPRPCCARASR